MVFWVQKRWAIKYVDVYTQYQYFEAFKINEGQIWSKTFVCVFSIVVMPKIYWQFAKYIWHTKEWKENIHDITVEKEL